MPRSRNFASLQHMFRQSIRQRRELRSRGYTTCPTCAGYGRHHARPCTTCHTLGLVPPQIKSPASGA